MKRLTKSALVLLALTALPAALAYGQNTIPPVYDATGAMMTAIAPQPTANPRAYPWVYDATGAMQAAVAPQPARLGEAPVLQADLVEASRIARLEAQADAAVQAEVDRTYGHVDLPTSQDALPPVYDATGAMLIALEPGPLEGNMAAVESRTVPDNGLVDPVERAYIERAMQVQGYTTTLGTIPPVYDATGVMQAAVVQSSEANVAVVQSPQTDAAVVAPPTSAAPRAEPSIYLVIGLGLLAAAALVGARMLSHRPATRHHGPRHV